MKVSLPNTIRAVFLSFFLLLSATFGCSSALADTGAIGTNSGTSGVIGTNSGTSGAVGTNSGTSGASLNPNKPGDFTEGSTRAISQISGLIGNIIATAVTVSNGVRQESDKFAWGLGIISLVLVGVRFSGTHHAIAAWVNLFEEFLILGVFVALYLGYTTTAPGFWNWFDQLASNIGGATDNAASTQMAKLGGAILDALRNQVGIIRAITDTNGMITDVVMLGLAFLVMCIASVVFMYFSAVGQIQAAFGIVLGPIAISLGFSSYTRHYFQKWLDWMISSGMYVVTVAILMRLMGTAISKAVTDSTTTGVGTTINSGFVFDLALFILLLSFEIPKLAGIFGGGATASGTGALKLARSFL